MDIPFPETTPRFIDSKWFSADTPCDEDAELTALEQSNQNWLSNVGQQYKARAPLGKADPEPMEECESEEEEDSVQIVEDSDEVEEEAEPPMNHDVDLLQIHEDSSHEDDAANTILVYNSLHPDKVGDSDDDLQSVASPLSAENSGDDVGDHNRCGDIAGNDESDESEESHDEDEEDDLQQSYQPPRSELPRTLDLTDSSEPNMSDQGTLWP